MAAVSTQERVLLFLLVLFAGLLGLSSGVTNSIDASALLALKNDWTNVPPSWGKSNDPCGTPWEGVYCKNSRVTMLTLASMGIKGTLSGDIGQLSELQNLDLSYNSDLGGPLPSSIGNLKQLISLSLLSCSFNGRIPELGALTNLSFLALNSNKFTGSIPASIGSLSNAFWIDLADNQLTGPLPISNSTSRTPGMDMLVNTKHFHFNKNQLSGPIPEQLFSSQMSLLHILFDHNQFSGTIPESIGLVKSLEIIRLDQNFLTGPVPKNISALTGLMELHLANNQLTGTLPDLTEISNLNYVDLSNNSFSPSTAPSWFSTLASLSALIIQSGGLIGQVPNGLFALPQLEEVILADNKLSGTLDMRNLSTSSYLQLVNFENNDIDNIEQTPSYTESLLLAGNPVCSSNSNAKYCRIQAQPPVPYSTSLAKCGSTSCNEDQSLDPGNCACAYPYKGLMVFRAPMFPDVTNSTPFLGLETTLPTNLSLPTGSVYISNIFWNGNSYLQLQLALFPSSGIYFNRSEIYRIGFDLSNQVYSAPKEFGPYTFSAYQYPFQGGTSKTLSIGAIAGIVIGCGFLVAALIVVGIYALQQKRKAKKAIEQTQPFASWGAGDKGAGSAPKLKGARWFPFEEIRKRTNNFSDNNELGAGGYGKVYKGILSDGQVVAIKRAQQGSMQGALEFKTEIELLSRLHHKNLVELVGFCYEKGEQMLVYEYIPNGTLRENLLGRDGVQLDWRKRLMIALDSARGLAYLHDLANPPIIHRDIKSANILLDEYLTAKVADFGLSKLVSDSKKSHVSTEVKGTLGYLDPEYYMTQQLSDKSDVYSFGVVMLELISGKLPIDKGKYIVREVRLAMNEDDAVYCGLENIMDPVLVRSSSNLVGFKRFLDLAMACVEESAEGRPSMNEVVKEIETLLMSHGMKIMESSDSSAAATEIGKTNDSDHLRQYDPSLKEYYDSSSGAFQYSGGYSFQKTVEPM